MTPLQSAAGPHLTHDVLNQVPLLAGYDVADDPALLSAAAREGAGWAEAELRELEALAAKRNQTQAELIRGLLLREIEQDKTGLRPVRRWLRSRRAVCCW